MDDEYSVGGDSPAYEFTGSQDSQGQAEENDEARLWKEVEKELPLDRKTLAKLVGKSVAAQDHEEELERATQDAEDLTTRLLNELAAPELLPFRAYDTLNTRAKANMEKALDPSASLTSLEKAILEMDANRFDFELVALNRARLRKIAKYPTYFLRNQVDDMTSEEIKFAQEYEQLRKGYYKKEFLSKLPTEFADLLDQNDEETYPKPNLNSFVILRSHTGRTLEVLPGVVAGPHSTFAGSYKQVKPHLMSGDICLV